MSKKAHTPGPWIYYADLPSNEPNWHIVTTANKQRLLANIHIEPGNEMDEANARLIAAAPDMLEALEKVSRSLDAEISAHRCSCTHPCDDYKVYPGPCGALRAEKYRNIKVVADAALSKATGGAS